MGTYLVTGMGRGIGHELARVLLRRGDRVIGTVRDEAGIAPEWAAFLASGQLRLVMLDVRDAASIGKAAAQIDEPIDVLVNNAGIIGPHRQSTLDMDFEGFLETLDVNTLGPLRIVQAFLPHLRRSKAPRIVTISSRMGSLSHAKSDRIAYRASKAAVNKVMQALATDLQGEGIVAISVHPGWVRTDMGGSGADISVEESAEGLIKLIDRVTLAESGLFFDWTGTQISF
ncbi:NAD(P)-dependent dehydrogenase (short-subunit alcohol dehydrogenase family) [Microvirga flocculans]|uniref:NAD(P)-dependent dehydrogenase (Short-subunit alcohol dehydrogenase family) n=1 Tax=Microvirga flocculans TaxID=217168 RepID=A0A7W6N7A5_9HYPH|nr:SDR family oxidoreductase [Microvirga flocculans]MBB4039270.1 NAD(P)-dependent dehydrogenase (short-subunit alcohol dehydrogenase family) [Microvirga flocculans]